MVNIHDDVNVCIVNVLIWNILINEYQNIRRFHDEQYTDVPFGST